MIDSIGNLITELTLAYTVTHVIVSDGSGSLRRTPKLLIGLCRTYNIVSLRWLQDSYQKGYAIPCDKYLVLNDRKAESSYDFSMQKTLERVKQRMNTGKYLLHGWSVHICRGVAGNKAPSTPELKLIVQAAGAEWIAKLTTSMVESPDKCKRILIITSKPDDKPENKSKRTNITTAILNGAAKRSIQWLLHSLMTQEVDLE
jgi:hypothetical protein